MVIYAAQDSKNTQSSPHLLVKQTKKPRMHPIVPTLSITDQPHQFLHKHDAHYESRKAITLRPACPVRETPQ